MGDKQWVHSYKEALSLDKDYLDKEHLSSSRLSALATEELEEGKIILDKNYLSDLTKNSIIAPIELLWGEWKRRRNIFMQDFEECYQHIEKLHALEEDIKYEQILRVEKLSKLEEDFKSSDDYLQTEENRKRALEYYSHLNKKYGRMPKDFALKKAYWGGIGVLCCIDIFINMQVFGPVENGIILAFLLPFILGIILSFSYHILGKISRQYEFLLVNTSQSRQKIENYGLLIAGAIALIFVLSIIGLFCDQAVIKGTLSRSFWHDASWAMLINFALWCLGFGVVYLSYDADPFYMTAQKKRQFWEEKFSFLKEDYAKRRKILVEESAREERLKIKKYEQLKQEYAEEFSLWEGIEAHEKWLKEQLYLLFSEELEEYRTILINRIQLLNPLPKILLDGEEITLEYYKSISFDISNLISLR